jgi:hypothetical protein
LLPPVQFYYGVLFKRLFTFLKKTKYAGTIQAILALDCARISVYRYNSAKAVTQTIPGSPKTAATEEVKKLIVTGAPVTGDKMQAAANPANPKAAESKPVLTGLFPNEHLRKSGYAGSSGSIQHKNSCIIYLPP